MKRIGVAALAVLGLFSYDALAESGSAQPKHDPTRFEQMKSMTVENHQKRIGILNDAIGCIQSAQNPQALKSCHDAEKSSMEQLKQAAEAQRNFFKR